MQLFPCPWCGPRVDSEFRYGGDADKPRPDRDCSDADWASYRFYRTNAKGNARELWLHVDGCSRWIELQRDTVTHNVVASRPMTA